MDTSFTSLTDAAASILVLLPTKPYFDQVAAGLSLYLSIHETKNVTISCPTPMMVGVNRIIGANKITTELGNKNLTIKFKDYDANNIEKVSYDIVNGEFNLTVVPKAGFTAPQKEQMDLNFSGVSADLIILVGGGNSSHFPILESTELSSAKIAHIGNRALSLNRDVMSFALPGATTSELVANLIKENNMPIDADIATNLVFGIEEGSESFMSSEVTPGTFETFAWLMRSGGQRLPKTNLVSTAFPPGSIPTQSFSQPRSVKSVPQMVPESNPDPVLEQVENKEEVLENPPDDWLQPKVFKGAAQPMGQSDSFSENKG
ncbi:MAG TPA: hypothetical protein VKC53_00980 [Patescibacteria group bacterium]|nr:hypothetical protein [Patescibacteria group bacterium]